MATQHVKSLVLDYLFCQIQYSADSDWMEEFIRSKNLGDEQIFATILKTVTIEDRYSLFLKSLSYEDTFICKLLLQEEIVTLQTIHPYSQNNLFHALCQSVFASNKLELYPIFEELFYLLLNSEPNFGTIQKLLGSKNILGHLPLHFVSHPLVWNLITNHMSNIDLQQYHQQHQNHIESNRPISSDLFFSDTSSSTPQQESATVVQMINSVSVGYDVRLQLKFGWKPLRDTSNKLMANYFKTIDCGNNHLWALNSLGQPMFYDASKCTWNTNFAYFFQTISNSVVSPFTLASTVLGVIRKKRSNDFAFDMFTGLTLTGLGFKHVSCASENVIYSIGNNQKVYRFSSQKGKWIELENQKSMKSVDCNASDDLYGIDEHGNFYKRIHSVKRWEIMEGKLRQICVLEDGTVLAIDIKQRACRYFPMEQQWRLLTESEQVSFCCITGDSIGNFYALHMNQQHVFVYKSMGYDEWEDLC